MKVTLAVTVVVTIDVGMTEALHSVCTLQYGLQLQTHIEYDVLHALYHS